MFYKFKGEGDQGAVLQQLTTGWTYCVQLSGKSDGRVIVSMEDGWSKEYGDYHMFAADWEPVA